MSAKKTVTVEQWHNAKYDDHKPETSENRRYIYNVVSAQNTTDYPVNSRLSKDQVDDMIENLDITVNIKPMAK